MNKVVLFAILSATGALAAELPVREVILYKNGIGYFVRGGELKAGETAQLQFKAGEMNDVLKSLTIFEAGGGKITGLRYDSSQPLKEKLAEFPFKLGAHEPLSALLDQLKGARIEMKTGPETLAGSIVGAREVAAGEKQPRREEVMLLLGSGELRTVDLGGVTAMRFADPVLEGQLVKYLGDVAAGRSKEKRSVYIDSTGETARKLTASYVVPAPVWKSSYRLAFGSDGDPVLEGWAIVDNTTGEDWRKVRLALVSGRPVSFITNLYEPRMVARLTAALPEEAAEAPELYGAAMYVPGAGLAMHEGMGMANRSDEFSRLERGARLFAPPPPPPPASPAPMAKVVRGLASTVTAPAEAAERGELFEYRFDNPVTVRDGQSAMLPFLQQKVGARKLLIFSASATEFPRNAVELSNNTGKTLDGGPITVFDGDAYAGEALMETLKAGDKRLVSYAVDQGTRVATKLDSSSGLVREIHARRGVLTVRTAIRESKTYTIRNVDAKPKTLVVEHPIRQGYRLTDAKPAESTASAYRFEVKLAPQATQKLPVTEERLLSEEVELNGTTTDQLMVYVENKELSAAARKQLQSIADQKRAIAANDAEIKRAEEQINDLVRDQERLRQNIASLNRVSGQQEAVQNYARQLVAQDGQLASLRERQAGLKDKRVALLTELERLIETMEF